MAQTNINVKEKAGEFLNEEVKTVEDALSGARDIIAEWSMKISYPGAESEICLKKKQKYFLK